MSILKLKTVLAVSIMGMMALSSPAFAQVTTDDEDAQGLLEHIRDDARNFRDDKIEPHYVKQIEHHGDQIEHYEREIKKLNAMIDSFGYWKSEGTGDPAVEGAPKNKAFEILADSTPAREAVHAAGEGNSSEFGIVLDGFDGDGLAGTNVLASNPARFRKALGLQAPKEIYGDDSGSHGDNLRRIYSSLYLANTVANEAHNGRVQRLEVYGRLLDEAKTTNDLQTELRVQNAILIENGRNLALLIDLQTAQLNAQTADIASLARSKNVPEAMFGSTTALGETAFNSLVGALSEGYSENN